MLKAELIEKRGLEFVNEHGKVDPLHVSVFSAFTRPNETLVKPLIVHVCVFVRENEKIDGFEGRQAR